MSLSGADSRWFPNLRFEDPLDRVLRKYLLSGDELAMEEVVRRTRPRLLAAARRIGRPQDAEDAVQSAYLSLVRKRGAELGAPVLPWLLTATIRCAYRRKAILASEGRLAAMLANEPPPSRSPMSDAMAAEEAAGVREGVARLPAHFRDPIVLHYMQGLSTAETALLLGVTDSAVRSRLHKARLLLRVRWLPRLALSAIPWLLPDPGKASSGGAIAAMGGVMTKTGFSGLLIAVAVAAAWTGATFLAPREPSPDLDSLREVATAPLQAEIVALRTEIGESRKWALSEQQRRKESEGQVAALQASLEESRRREEAQAASATPPIMTAADAPPGDAAHREEEALRSRFSSDAYGAVLATVNWSEVGSRLAVLPTLIHRLGEASAKGGTPDMEVVGELQKNLGELNRAAGAVVGKIPGSGPYGAFTHPAFMVNAIAATLDAAKLPLSLEQTRALDAIGRDYEARDAARTSRYDDRTWELEKRIEEGTLKDGFFEGAFALLTAAQRDALSPPSTRGLVGIDAFSSGLMWAQYLRPVSFTTRESLAEQVTGRLGTLLVRSEGGADLRGVVSEWMASLPAEWFTEAPHAVFGSPVLSAARVTEAARHDLVLLRAAVRAIGTVDAEVRARAAGNVLVPVYARP